MHVKCKSFNIPVTLNEYSLIMIRNNSALFLSFTIHALIAAAAFFVYQKAHEGMPSLEKRICVSLTHFVEAAPVIPKPKAVQPKPEPKPVMSKKAEPVKPVVAKPVEVPKPEPKPVVKQIPIADPVVKKAEPVIEPVQVVEEIVEPVVAEAVTEPQVAVQEPVAAAEPVVEAVEAPVMPAPTAEELYMQAHLVQIAKLLKENLYYPRSARKRGITGEVLVAFELLQSGEVTQIDVKSGERGILNRAAIKTIERLSGKFPKPGAPLTLNVPIRYQLQ